MYTRKMWTSTEIDFIKENYKNMTSNEISKALNRTPKSVKMKVHKLGLTKPKYTFNKSFFKDIDSEEKAYWLGFIYADGYVINKTYNNKESNYLGIELKKSDSTHLKKFNKSLNGNLKITYKKTDGGFNGRIYETCKIVVCSKELVYDLKKHGVYQNKTLTMKFPKLDDKLINHFIRGYFDGDGCIAKSNHKNGKSYAKCDFACGSIEFVKTLRETLNKKDIKSYISKEKNKNTYRLVVSGMINCDKFLNYIYKDSSIFLDRKYYKKERIYKELDIVTRIALLNRNI